MRDADVVVYTDPAMLAAGERVAGTRVDMLRCAPGSLRFEPGRPTLAALDLIDAKAITPGEATEAGGRAALTALETAADAAKRGEIDGIVFAPLNKHAMRLGGLAQEDELRYLQEKFGVTGFVSEFNVTGALWTSRVTSHIPLREVADAITGEGVCAAVAHRRSLPQGRGHRGAAHRSRGAQSARGRRRLDRPRGDRHHRARGGALAPGRHRRPRAAVARHPVSRRAPRRFRRRGVDVPRPGPDRDEAHGLRQRRHAARRTAGARDDVRERQRVRHRRPQHRRGPTASWRRSTSPRASRPRRWTRALTGTARRPSGCRRGAEVARCVLCLEVSNSRRAHGCSAF